MTWSHMSLPARGPANASGADLDCRVTCHSFWGGSLSSTATQGRTTHSQTEYR